MAERITFIDCALNLTKKGRTSPSFLHLKQQEKKGQKFKSLMGYVVRSWTIVKIMGSEVNLVYGWRNDTIRSSIHMRGSCFFVGGMRIFIHRFILYPSLSPAV